MSQVSVRGPSNKHLVDNQERGSSIPRRFQPGDTVRLLSGGPSMTVVGYVDLRARPTVEVRWFRSDNMLESMEFPEDGLIDGFDGDTGTQTDSAVKWLGNFLADGPKDSSVVKTAARSLGYTEAVLRRARTRLRVRMRRVGKAGPHHVCWWSL